MKRILLITVFFLVVLGGGGYVGGAWWFGQQIEADLQAKIAKIQAQLPPNMKLSHTFQRGLFKSVTSDTLTLAFPYGNQPLSLSIQTTITHLPLSRLLHQEVASADSVVRLDPDMPDWTGSQPLANVHSVLRFGGSGATTVSMPALNSARLKSAAGQIQMDFSKDLANYSIQGNIPSLTILAGNQPGPSVTMSGIQINSSNSLIAPYQHLYSGTGQFQISQVQTSDGIGQIKNLSASGSMSSSGSGLVDLKMKYGMESMKLAGQEYGPAHFDVSLHHLDAATLDSLSQMSGTGATPNPAQAIAGLQTLLMRDPELSIDQLSFNVPEGEALVTADLKVQGIKESDFANPLLMVNKALVKADLKLPEPLLMAILSRPSPQPAMPMQPSMPAPDYGAQLESMVKAGYVTREGGFVSTHIEMSGGNLALNGRSLNLMAPPR